MKKTTALLTVSALILALAACGNSTPAATTTAKSEPSAVATTESGNKDTSAERTTAPEETEKTTAKPVEEKPGFKQTATINETVLVDQDGIKVTAKELTYTKYEAKLELSLENNSDKDLELMSGTLGYSCNSINGVMFSGGYFNCDVGAGKKANESVSFKYKDLMRYGIYEIADIELGVYSEDGDYNYTYYPVSQIKTSAAGSYGYDDSSYLKALTSSDVQSDNNYKVVYAAQDKLYDVDDVRIVSETLIEDEDGDPTLLIEAHNDSAYQSRLGVSDIDINGIRVSSGRWTSELINPGKTVFIDVDLASVFYKTYWEMYGINEIKNIKFVATQSDFEGENESTPADIEIPVVAGSNTADTSGTVAYDEGGVRVIYKGITGGRYDYDKDLYVMLLVENNSGHKIHIDDDNMSVNGYMVDTMAFSANIEDGTCAVWKMEIYSRSLEKCEIKDASEIKNIEFTLEIRDQDWRNKKEGEVKINIG